MKGILESICDYVKKKDLVLISARDRLFLIGENGSGKTTLLKITQGIVQADSGRLRIAPSAKVGYLEQDFDTLADGPVYNILGRQFGLTSEEAAIELHKIGLPPHDVRIEQYSIGQKRRLQFLFLKIMRANVLLLDEPTNHLDLASLEDLEEALLNFEGAIVAVTHDRRFLHLMSQDLAIWA